MSTEWTGTEGSRGWEQKAVTCSLFLSGGILVLWLELGHLNPAEVWKERLLLNWIFNQGHTGVSDFLLGGIGPNSPPPPIQTLNGDAQTGNMVSTGCLQRGKSSSGAPQVGRGELGSAFQVDSTHLPQHRHWHLWPCTALPSAESRSYHWHFICSWKINADSFEKGRPSFVMSLAGVSKVSLSYPSLPLGVLNEHNQLVM